MFTVGGLNYNKYYNQFFVHNLTLKMTSAIDSRTES